jgi:hypothetical protein
MPTRVTIILETGAFLYDVQDKKPHIDVGYFETPFASDIEVRVDGRQVQPPPDPKLGDGNNRIDVQHLEADGTTVKTRVDRSPSFEQDLLRKVDLYGPTEVPDFIETAYDCILRFQSGVFESSDVRTRRFTKHLVGNDQDARDDNHTRPIANKILVHYDLADGEVLRLRRPNGKDLWSSDSVARPAKLVEVRLLTDDVLKASYHKTALRHKATHYYLPNSDPPPMNSHGGG